MQRTRSRERAGATGAGFLLRTMAVCLAIGLSAGVAGAAAQPATDDTLEWLDDYQEALARAREEGLPLLVEFRCAP